jgi:hypothetical protein
MKNGDPCNKERCLKETNHDYKPGVYLGKPFVYEDCWMACIFCSGEVSAEDAQGSVEQVVSLAGCKPVVSDCGGSIPSAPTIKKKGLVF